MGATGGGTAGDFNAALRERTALHRDDSIVYYGTAIRGGMGSPRLPVAGDSHFHSERRPRFMPDWGKDGNSNRSRSVGCDALHAEIEGVLPGQ